MEFLQINLYKIIFFYIAFNLISFYLFYEDKRRAIKHGDRISENTLILISLFFPIGSLFSMLLFRHKTRKLKFKLVYVFFIVHLFLFIYFLNSF